MGANTWGQCFQITSFGESHGAALGVLIEGCPAGVSFSEDLLRRELERRRPGQSAWVTARQEPDHAEVYSGVYQGRTLGTPILMMVRNQDARSQDYAQMPDRPGHADDLWREKFGHSDPRGGGRSSGRETVARVMGGAVARMMLEALSPGIQVKGFARQIGPLLLQEEEEASLSLATEIDSFPARFPSPSQRQAVEQLLVDAKSQGKSYGGEVELWMEGVPRGWGQPVFHKLKSDMAAALMSVGATAGVELGEGFGSSGEEGSVFHRRVAAESPYGGIRGGLSTGERIRARVAFKPTATVLDAAKKGRHDPCIVPRAIPVLEAMMWLVLADHALWARRDRL